MQLHNLGKIAIYGGPKSILSGQGGKQGNVDLWGCLVLRALHHASCGTTYVHEKSHISNIAFFGIDEFF